jgi:putative transposase
VTYYLTKQNDASLTSDGKDIGIDLGISSNLTLSNDIAIDFEIHKTQRLERLRRKFARTEKGSKNRDRIRLVLRKEYERLSNRRKDDQNNVLVFLRIYSRVVFQDDCIKGWGNVFGKQVHSSGTGRLKSKLRNSFKTLIVILGFEPTSQECFVCSNLCKLSLLDRIIKCECGRQCY